MTSGYAHQTLQVPVDDASAVHEVERAARRLADTLRFPAQRREEVAIAARELASNVYKHTRGGVLYLQAMPESLGSLELVAADDGPGVEGFDRCLADGYSTTGTLGTGLGAVRRLATRFAAYSLASRGSVVLADFAPRSDAAQDDVDLGVLCLPAPGETVTGDGYGLVQGERGWTLLVVDGLGHGEGAAEASRAALDLLPEHADAGLAETLRRMHAGLRKTRGAAAALLRVDADRGHAQFCGVGNVSGAVFDHGRHGRRLASQPGIVGGNLPRPAAQQFPLPPDATLLLHTDGISGRWNLDPYPGLLGQPPAVTAAVLMHEYRRTSDDSTVAVLRPRRVRGPMRQRAGGDAAEGTVWP